METLTVTVDRPDGTTRDCAVRLHPDGADPAGSGAFRVAPLLQVLGTGPDRRVVVGQVDLRVHEGDADLLLRLDGVWPTRTWRREEAGQHEDLTRELTAVLGSAPRHRVLGDDDQALATLLAKVVAEQSRDAVTDLRRLRYELEETLGDAGPAARAVGPGPLRTLLGLSVVVNRARDVARTAVREGFQLWQDDDEAYHAYRKAMDPTLLNDVPPATAQTRPWMRTHDAGVRQCAAADAQLTEEAVLVASLMDAAATAAALREADAQQTFNTLATVATLGLGLPALVLSLYGADFFLELSGARQALALVPIGVATLLAGLVGVLRLPVGHDPRPRRLPVHLTRTAAAVLLTLALLVLLALAGGIGARVHGSSPSPVPATSPR